jgi:hypothetical protein
MALSSKPRIRRRAALLIPRLGIPILAVGIPFLAAFHRHPPIYDVLAVGGIGLIGFAVVGAYAGKTLFAHHSGAKTRAEHPLTLWLLLGFSIFAISALAARLIGFLVRAP